MDKGFVYIGRLVDHNGDFVSSYRKLGKSIDFKTREINLNSTHLPLDVLFVRVFETEHMSSLEKVLHACYQEYRVVKEYDWRRNVTTEWFDVDDDDLFDQKIDSVIKYFPNTKEVNNDELRSHVMSDSGTTTNEKVEIIKTMDKVRKKWKLSVHIDNKDVSCDYASETMKKVFKYVVDKVGIDIVADDESVFHNSKEEMINRFGGWKGFSIGVLKEIDGYWLHTGINNSEKLKIIRRMSKKYNLPEIVSEIIEVK
ncbi:GIY-YIG nuclease family protein [bacterium]|nr:GIY-YIG nuclease family protein [bacterium]